MSAAKNISSKTNQDTVSSHEMPNIPENNEQIVKNEKIATSSNSSRKKTAAKKNSTKKNKVKSNIEDLPLINSEPLLVQTQEARKKKSSSKKPTKTTKKEAVDKIKTIEKIVSANEPKPIGHKPKKINIKIGGTKEKTINLDEEYKLVLDSEPGSAGEGSTITPAQADQSIAKITEPFAQPENIVNVTDAKSNIVPDIEDNDFKSKLEKAGLTAPSVDSIVNVNSKPIPNDPTPEDTSSGFHLPTVRSLSLYKKIAVSFIGLTLILIAIVFYYSFTKLHIIIYPNIEKQKDALIIDIHDKNKLKNADNSTVIGRVDKLEITENAKEPISGSEVVGSEVTGSVVIYNTSANNQSLVATTRLLSADNKLFRTKETLTVPAGGSITAEVYADKPSAEMGVATSTHFNIIRLAPVLQTKIYAENPTAIEYKEKLKKIVKQNDIDSAASDIKQKLLEKVKSEIAIAYKDYKQVLFTIDETTYDIKTNAKIGDEMDALPVDIKAIVNVTAFNDDQINDLVKQKILSTLPTTKELYDMGSSTKTYSLSNFNYNEGIASINVESESRVILKKGADIVKRNEIAGMSKTELENYLRKMPEISNFTFQFSPSFIQRAPRLTDRISIEVKR